MTFWGENKKGGAHVPFGEGHKRCKEKRATRVNTFFSSSSQFRRTFFGTSTRQVLRDDLPFVFGGETSEIFAREPSDPSVCAVEAPRDPDPDPNPDPGLHPVLAVGGVLDTVAAS